ncbi:GspE/PulE/PilB domain-containing protein [Pelobacter propionicus]|uniref:General secretory system II, protein E domain protein n=1 Tax=Pelobacter propionicus (strain DSM 2379 / NBRC 103807 / OttBd1) TaxID=338966 RepID=A1AV36_PELPD|nr:general secretion pathway protein GspE [Pelobacter propionicus]ABL01207.1 General secretory system II, protein E domain protein [Pelobacter propionicus DSM 2379]
MELRLGELLLRDRLITNTQLEEALESQAGRGIKLGSALFELGYVEENALGRALSAKLGVPFVGRSELSSIPGDLIRDFSRSMAVKYNVMPFKLERNRLGLAMSDPNDFRALEDIAFMTGCVVQPYIAPDVRISDAQARYYRISGGESRYRRLADLRRRNSPPCPGQAAMPEEEQRPRQDEAVEYEDFSCLNEALAGEGSCSETIARPAVPQRTSGKLARAGSTDEVGDLLIEHMGQLFGTGALFQMRGTGAVGWRGVSNGRRIDLIETDDLVLHESSVVRDVAEGRRYSLGPLMDTPENRRILQLLELPGDASLFVLPVVLGNRAVAVLLVSVEMDDPMACLAELRTLAHEAERALAMLIIRKKGMSQ